MFPRTFPDEVRQHADIVRIVSDYVALKKRGQNWIACCPFHSEKTPSFNVHAGKGIFKCFGCGAAGNVFNFVMQIEGCTFTEAVRTVAEKSGIPIPEAREKPAEVRQEERRRKRLSEINDWAAEFFEEQLGRGGEGRRALDYFEERGITSTTRERLRLGYAPNSWDALSSHLTSRGASREEIADSGLVTLKEGGGGYYDRFRGRVIFPIREVGGRVVAFGGRALGDEKPKYLNSPETAVYTKGRHLFGLAFAKEAIRRAGFAILVEGYFDFVVPFQAGVENVVASLGTALTEQQSRLLRRYMERPQIVVNYDADTAGQEATARSFETLLLQGFRINVLALPEGKDPDEFVRERGADAYRALLKTTVPYIDYVIDRAVGRYDVKRPSGKAEALNEILPHISHVADGVERDEYAKRAAERLRIEDEILRNELRRAARRREPKLRADHPAGGKGTGSRGVRAAALTPLERRFLVVLLGDPGVRSFVLPSLEDEDIEGLAAEPVFRAIREAHRSGDPIGYAEVSEQLSESARQLLASLVSSDTGDTELEANVAKWKGTWDEKLRHEATICFEQLRRKRYERERERVQQEIRRAEQDGDLDSRYPELIKRKLELTRLLASMVSDQG